MELSIGSGNDVEVLKESQVGCSQVVSMEEKPDLALFGFGFPEFPDTDDFKPALRA